MARHRHPFAVHLKDLQGDALVDAAADDAFLAVGTARGAELVDMSVGWYDVLVAAFWPDQGRSVWAADVLALGYQLAVGRLEHENSAGDLSRAVRQMDALESLVRAAVADHARNNDGD